MKPTIKTHNMKKLLFLLLLFTGLANAQIVNIPDANFKAKLLEADVSNPIAQNVGNNIRVDSNNDGQIQQSEALQVTYLYIDNSNIINLTGIEFFTNLTDLYSSGNLLITLNLTSLTNLKHLGVSNNQLSSIDVSQNLFLRTLSCYNNQLTNIDVTQNLMLKYLLINSNQFTSIDISQNLILETLWCHSNQLTNLNVTQNLVLKRLVCSNNQLTSINLSQNLILESLLCDSNQLISLDLNKNLNLETLLCYSNQLTSLFIKNGINEIDLSFSNNPNLNFICADDTQISEVQDKISSYGYDDTCSLNTYCSFSPSGNYNTIAGNLKFDANNNGCDANDLTQPNIRVNINDGTLIEASFTSTTGDYKFYTQAGSFAITPVVENPTWFNFTPATATIPFANNNNNTATQDFCISANGVHHDLEIFIAPIGVARPGFDAEYQITYSNRGNSNFANGEISLVFNDAILDFIQASNIPISQNNGAINWIFSNLLPFETRTISVVFNVNSPVETPAVNINDVLTYTVNCYPSYFEENVANNQLIYNQTVVGSFDPNNIECLEGNSVAPSEIGNYLHYVINFENTGNFPAENVVVKTIVDPAKFDINSLQLLNTSNPVDARITGNVVEFIFEDIQLAGPGGHGHVLLKIKSKSTLVTGDNVAKSAGIYFDYNAPVDTGMATTVFESLSNAVFEKDNSVSISPNPTTSIINVNSDFNIKMIEMYDVQGRIIETHISDTKTLDISDKANGIYFLKITTEKGGKIEKVIKE